jgi:monoamine oxidase
MAAKKQKAAAAEAPRARNSADVIVLGGGHNGLVAAAYLARAGIKTILLEARGELGGMALTARRARPRTRGERSTCGARGALVCTTPT